MKKAESWKISDISIYRGVLMGIATLFVVFRHMSFDFDYLLNDCGTAGYIFGGILKILREFSSVGVDIFLILSGFGLFYSFSKNSSLKNYYIKRFTKVVLPFWIVSAFFYMLESKSDSAFSFLMNATRVRFVLTGGRCYWFFFLIIALYIIFPLFYKCISKFRFVGMLVLVIAVVLLNTLLFLLNRDFYGNVEIAICRIPAFIIGIYAGYLSKFQEVTFSNRACKWVSASYIVSACGVAFYFLLMNMDYKNFSFVLYYDMELVAISLVIMFSDICRRFRMKGTKVFLTWLGGYSLEVYLFYESFLGLFKYLKISSDLPATYSLIIFVFTLIFSVLFKLLCGEIESKIKKIKDEF